MDTLLQSLGSIPGAYAAKLAAGGWPNTSGHEDYAQHQNLSHREVAYQYHQSFTLTLGYLTANPTSRIHSTQLVADVQAANPDLTFDIVETACISAALSTTAGFKGAPGTTRALVERDDGESEWRDVEGAWLTKP